MRDVHSVVGLLVYVYYLIYLFSLFVQVYLYTLLAVLETICNIIGARFSNLMIQCTEAKQLPFCVLTFPIKLCLSFCVFS